MGTFPVSRDAILQQLERILSSGAFAGAVRSTALLKFLVEQAVEGRPDRLKEYTLGAEALGKGESFDPRIDPIVRAEASRLRSRLERYYATEGQRDSVIVSLPKGTYVPQFQARTAEDDRGSQGADSLLRSSYHLERGAWLTLGGIIAGCALAVAIWFSTRVTSTTQPGSPQLEVELIRGEVVGSTVGTDVIISPDGTRLVFATRRADGVTRLMTRRLEDFAIIELPGTDGARSPFFSPDGRWVGFLASGKLQKVAVDGGLPVALADAVDLLGASWGEDGRIIAALSFGKLVSVPSSPAASTVVVDLAHERIEPRWPQILPDGRHVLFTAVGPPGANRANIEVLSLTDLKRTILVRGGTYGRYLPAGFLTYVNQGALFAQPFDVAQMTTSGTATVILDGISYSPTFGFAQLDISRTGTLVYRRSPARGQLIAAWLDRSGRAEPLPMKPGQYTFPRLSPDRRRVAAMVTESGTGQLVIYDRELDHTKRLPATPSNYSPVWSPDGTFLLLGGPGGIRWTKTDTVESLVSLTRKGAVQIPWSFTSDGTRLAYHEFDASTGFDLWTVPLRRTANGLAAAGEPEPFLRTPAFETYPSFSPDDRWVAYASGDYGRWEVYVRPFPDTGAVPVKISEAGGRIAKWLPDGPSLLYRTDDHRIMVTTYTVKNGTFVADVPRQWMPGRLADTDVLSNFDLNPDDQRIVGLLPARPEDQQSPSHATVILNFFDSVRRRMSANGT